MKQLALRVTCFDYKCLTESHLFVRSEEFKRQQEHSTVADNWQVHVRH